ncbi:MAG: S46 family peptidase [Bacteroidota bacterium]|nr:S46 family peptidase [Bacteroidota bacterium]
MKKSILLLFFAAAMVFQGSAKEGMWIPMLLNKFVEKDMREMGMRLTAEDIYSINHSSLKDAIIIFGRGCTGELVSDQGLILTNHHCGYGAIQSHSSVEHDYLTDGFWAMNKSEELSNPGLKATFLIRIEDVTEKILADVTNNMTQAERKEIINKHKKALAEETTEDTRYKAVIKPFYYGNEYYMFIYEEYTDVRLVGAPPSNIGKFGGDTDNWMWPRHTGDFSVFRIYADKDNNPSEYSKDNVPYKPKQHLKINLKGYEKDDFTFVFGYPGTTQEYLPSFAIEMNTKDINPIRINMRTKALDIIKSYMASDKKIRIQYSAKSAHIANGWKKWQGENRGIKNINAILKKQHLETSFIKWAKESDEYSEKYGNLISEFNDVYQQLTPYNTAKTYLTESIYNIEIARFARSFDKLIKLSKQDDTEDEAIADEINNLRKKTKNFFKNYYLPIDNEVTSSLLSTYYTNINTNQHPEIFKEVTKDYKGDFSAYADDLFKNSFMSSEEGVNKFLDKYKARKYKKIEKDPAHILAKSLFGHYFTKILPATGTLNAQLDSLQRIYMKGLMEFQKSKHFYPDANFTLRVTYGKVQAFEPRDGVSYDYYTTLSGIMEKENPDIYDYVVEDKLKELYNEKDYGQYADKDGSMHVCFIASNHTSGGNSGSPILNADGHLIGINFDRNWEGTMSDLMYDPDQCRNISIDIRYCLFIIDKFAGAGHLVKEMTLVK